MLQDARFVAIILLSTTKHMFVYTLQVHMILYYTLKPPVAPRQWRQSVGGPRRQQKCRSHIILYNVCARCTRVYTTPRRFVKKLALSGRNHLRRRC